MRPEEELFEIIRKYHELIEKRSEMEDESDSTSPDLFENNDEYAGLCVEAMDLLSKIDELMIDTKYAPLHGLYESQIKDLDFFIKSSDSAFEQNIEKHLEFRLLQLTEDMKKRLGEIKTLRMTTHLDPRTYDTYNEAIRCYVYGAFNASCVLCRAIAEGIAKRFIEYKGYKNLLVGEERESKKLSVAGILSEKRLVEKEVVAIYSKITRKADKVLHENNEKTEKQDALEMIELLQAFIKRFPKTL